MIKPKIVILCGSTRFTDEMLLKQFEMRKQGIIAIGWCAVPYGYSNRTDHLAELEGVKKTLDEVHKRMIDLSDEIFVLNINGYIGESTKSEIDYAMKMNKKVVYQNEK